MVEAVTLFKASDGSIFNTQDDAVKYEEGLGQTRVVDLFVLKRWGAENRYGKAIKETILQYLEFERLYNEDPAIVESWGKEDEAVAPPVLVVE